jgi:AGCS family alanine or glycine:cation symporter
MGVLFKAEAIWSVSDISNGLMAFPNLIALILLIKNVRRE